MRLFFEKLPEVRLKQASGFLIMSVVLFMLSSALRPTQHYAHFTAHFEQMIPTHFSEWHLVENTLPQVSVVSDERSLVNQLYDDVLMRTYTNKNGQMVMLALAYAKLQRQDVKIHQPDVCYPAQGFQLLESNQKHFDTLKSDSPVIGKQQIYIGQDQLQAVSYWIRVGDNTMLSGLQMRTKIVTDGLFKRRLDDGILVRVSSPISDKNKASESYALQEEFLSAFVGVVEKQYPGLLIPNHHS